MLALDKPFISSATDSSLETWGEFCLEYGSATQLYLVPIIPHKEQVRDDYFMDYFILKMLS